MSRLKRLRSAFLSAHDFGEHCGHTFYARPFRPGDPLVDLGANVGEFSSYMANRFGLRCLAVEPVPELFASIPSSPLITKKNIAIAAQEGQIDFYADDRSEWGSLTAAPGRRKISVPSCRLETLLEQHGITRGALLKIDIEGAERDLFSSTDNATLLRFDQISIEFHDFMPELGMAGDVKRIIERLRSIGFTLLRAVNTNMDCLFLGPKLRLPVCVRLYAGVTSRYYELSHSRPIEPPGRP